MINVSRPFLPPFEEYSRYLEQIWNRCWLTNQGPLVIELESQLKKYLEVNYVQFVTSGTVALHIAIKALELKGEVITTAFSHVSALNAIIWAGCNPVFVDIEERSYCIDASKIEAEITDQTSAIMATHVYGYPCEVKKIEAIAHKYDLKVIYDGAHAFGVKVNNDSIFKYGDVSIVSFHATKLYHSVEGGAIFTSDDNLNKKIHLLKTFGLENTESVCPGTNGKNSEFHAAMGLCNLPRVGSFIEKQRKLSLFYRAALKDLPLEFPVHLEGETYNYAYFPVVFPDSDQMLAVKEMLAKNEIFARRYFYPSLNKLSYYNYKRADCPIAEELSEKVLCLPLYYELSENDAERITNIIIGYYQLNSLIEVARTVKLVS